MKAPLSWLADYVDLDLPVRDLAHRLTMANLKVEGIDEIGADWQDVVTGQVMTAEPHPTSRKPLLVTEVDLGDRTETIVTGAPNVAAGDKVPVVPVGGMIPHGPDGEPMLITPRPMAGITSHGMLASARELGLSDEHSGIYTLPPDTPVGVQLRSVLGDDVLDLETQTNRPDTLSMIGIAREVAAVTEQQMTLPDLDEVTGQVQMIPSPSYGVSIEAPDLCSRYVALRVDGVAGGSSPRWLARRLEEAGMRSISLIVDITNYVMLEYGQPLHAFDREKLRGDIVVRRARPGETLRTLDGVERTLGPDDLVIADAERAIAIAGVMGGAETEIGPETRSIILESATFDAASTRRTAQSVGLRTEASARFEKQLPPETAPLGAKRFLQLLAQLSDGPLSAYELTDVRAGKPEERVVELPLSLLDRLLGISIGMDEAAEALSLQGFDVAEGDGSLAVRVPFWRRADIALPVDLVEEVARMVGYDRLPETLPSAVEPAAPLPGLYWEGVTRERLLAAGVSEAVTGTLTSAASMARLFAGEEGEWATVVPNAAGVSAEEALIEPIPLRNPPTRDRDVLRLTLLPSLLDVVSRNLRHTHERLAFFEIARTYFPRPGDRLPYERRTLAVALSGTRRPVNWQDAPGPYTFFDLKGVLAAVLDALGVSGWSTEPRPHPALHPGRSAVVVVAGRDVAYVGEAHPLVAARFDIEGWPVQVAEIDLDALFEHASDVRTFQPLPRYPAARRDVAVLVPETVPAGDILRIVRAAGGEMLESATIFDVYVGAPLPEGTKSLAVGMEFRAPGATLNQEEIGEIMDRIVLALGEGVGAKLRE